MSKITFSMNPCFAVKRWPEPDEWMRVVKEEFALDEIQYTFDLVDPRTSEPARSKMVTQTVEAAMKYGISMHSSFTGLAGYTFSLLLHPDVAMRMDALAWYEEAVSMTTELGIPGTGGHVGAMSARDWANPARKAELLAFEFEAVRHLAWLAKNQGQEFFLWEAMPVDREPPSRLQQAREFIERVNDGNPGAPVYYCLDLGHQCAPEASGEDIDVLAWIRALGKVSPVYHVQQTDGKGDRHWPFTPEFNERGIIRPQEILAAMHEFGSEESHLVFELVLPYEATDQHVLDAVKRSVDYWKEAEAKC